MQMGIGIDWTLALSSFLFSEKGMGNGKLETMGLRNRHWERETKRGLGGLFLISKL